VAAVVSRQMVRPAGITAASLLVGTRPSSGHDAGLDQDRHDVPGGGGGDIAGGLVADITEDGSIVPSKDIPMALTARIPRTFRFVFLTAAEVALRVTVAATKLNAMSRRMITYLPQGFLLGNDSRRLIYIYTHS